MIHEENSTNDQSESKPVRAFCLLSFSILLFSCLVVCRNKNLFDLSR